MSSVFDDLLSSFEELSTILNNEELKNEVAKIKNSISLTESLESGATNLFMDLINQEYNLLSQYESALVTLEENGESRFSDVFDYIKDDINIHIGMLQASIEDLDDSASNIEDGKEQAEQLILDESLFNESINSKDLILDAINTFIDLGSYPIDPDMFGCDSWEELRDQVEMGIDYIPTEIASIIIDYLKPSIDFNRKHPEIIEDDPLADIEQDIYDDMHKIVSDYN